MRILLLLLLSALLTACASTIPATIREAPPDKLSVGEAHAGRGATGARVRWGGTIAKVENHATETWLEIVSRPLESNGRPQRTDQTDGRFIAKVNGFLDPDVYKNGRQVTVTGAFDGRIERAIGEHTYNFPIIAATQVYLWPQERPMAAYDPWYDPWYSPWYPYGYPWGPWPYYPYRRY